MVITLAFLFFPNPKIAFPIGPPNLRAVNWKMEIHFSYSPSNIDLFPILLISENFGNSLFTK